MQLPMVVGLGCADGFIGAVTICRYLLALAATDTPRDTMEVC